MDGPQRCGRKCLQPAVQNECNRGCPMLRGKSAEERVAGVAYHWFFTQACTTPSNAQLHPTGPGYRKLKKKRVKPPLANRAPVHTHHRYQQWILGGDLGGSNTPFPRLPDSPDKRCWGDPRPPFWVNLGNSQTLEFPQKLAVNYVPEAAIFERTQTLVRDLKVYT